MVHINKGNEKLGFIPSVSMPAGLTCRHDCNCAKGCYAKKGNFRFDNVSKAVQENYQEYKRDSQNFFNEINNFLHNGEITYNYFRWSVSGDLVDYKYLLGIIDIANKNKYTKFLVFTKKFDLVNLYLTLKNKLPKNIVIVFSHWDNEFKNKVDNPYNLPLAFVDFKNKHKNVEHSKYAFVCPGSCKDCGHHCWRMKQGQQVIFHQH